MTETQDKKPIYDLEERTFQFAKAVRTFIDSSEIKITEDAYVI